VQSLNRCDFYSSFITISWKTILNTEAVVHYPFFFGIRWFVLSVHIAVPSAFMGSSPGLARRWWVTACLAVILVQHLLAYGFTFYYSIADPLFVKRGLSQSLSLLLTAFVSGVVLLTAGALLADLWPRPYGSLGGGR
jgi:hypothetical protein